VWLGVRAPGAALSNAVDLGRPGDEVITPVSGPVLSTSLVGVVGRRREMKRLPAARLRGGAGEFGLDLARLGGLELNSIARGSADSYVIAMRLAADPETARWLEALGGRSEDFEWDSGNRSKNLKHGVKSENVAKEGESAL
jgi:hypothetical protein